MSTEFMLYVRLLHCLILRMRAFEDAVDSDCDRSDLFED